jgi:streptogramin lyase
VGANGPGQPPAPAGALTCPGVNAATQALATSVCSELVAQATVGRVCRTWLRGPPPEIPVALPAIEDASDPRTVGGGSTWVANTLDGTISRIDREHHEVVSIDVGGAPHGLAFGAGSLWVADGDARSVAQVDPGANKTAPAGCEAVVLARLTG